MKYLILIILLSVIKPFYTKHQIGYNKDTCYSNCVNNKGLKQGIWKDYYKNGKLKMSSYYQNDTLHGVCYTYYKSGKIESSGMYKNGQKVEDYLYYNQEGLIIMKITFSDGKRKKLLKYYKKKVIYEEYYKNGEIDKVVVNGEEGKPIKR